MTKLLGALLVIVFLLLLLTFIREPHRVIFLNAPTISPVENFTYRTERPMRVSIDYDQMIIVPRHFDTDLASIPRIFWAILPPQQANFVAPAVLHDYMYTKHIESRKYADDVLYAGLRAQGAMWITANIIWLGVRLGGGIHYAK